MPARKYPDLAHLSPEEYKIEAEKRRSKDRTEYNKQLYLKRKSELVSERLNERIENTKKKLQSLESMVASAENNVSA
jgi:hypothetical protein